MLFRKIPVIVFLAIIASAGCKGTKKPMGSNPGNQGSGTSTPTPTPSEKYPGLPSSCQNLENGPGGSCRDANQNYDRTFVFQQTVERAVETTVQANPSFFDGDIIKNMDGYIRALAQTLNGQGICAVFDGENLFVRDQRNLSELFAAFYNSQQGPKPRGFTRSTCSPALPMPAFRTSPPKNDEWCPLPDSRNDGGCAPKTYGVWSSAAETIVRAVVDSERPKGAASVVFDFNDNNNPNCDYCVRVKNKDLYAALLREKSHQQNFCAYVANDTLMLKAPNGGNAVSESYDVRLDNGEIGYVRVPGYIATCGPAEF